MKTEKGTVMEVLGIEVTGKGKIPFGEIGEIRISDGMFTYVMGDFKLDDINIDRIDKRKLLEAMIVRERTILATRGVSNATEKAKTAIKRRCYKEKEFNADDWIYWRANDWFWIMENGGILK